MRKPTKTTIRIKKPLYTGWFHKEVGRVLQDDALLQALKQHSLYLRQLQSAVSSTLQALTQVSLPVDVSRYESGVLKLYVPNPAIATRLRFLQQDLLNALIAHEAFRYLVKIMVKIEPSVAANLSAPSAPRLRSASKNSAIFLQGNLIDNEDQQLSDALQRLARHCR
jgi:hypothetical protein